MTLVAKCCKLQCNWLELLLFPLVGALFASLKSIGPGSLVVVLDELIETGIVLDELIDEIGIVLDELIETGIVLDELIGEVLPIVVATPERPLLRIPAATPERPLLRCPCGHAGATTAPQGVHINEVELDSEEVGVLEAEVVILLLGVEVELLFQTNFPPNSLCPP